MVNMGKEDLYQKLQRMMSELPVPIINKQGILTREATKPPVNRVAERFYTLDQRGRDNEIIKPEDLMGLRITCIALGLLSDTFNLDIPWSGKVGRALLKRPVNADGRPDTRSMKWRGGIPCGLGKYSRRNGNGRR